MITALHTLINAEDPETARAFFRDVLRFPSIDTGAGAGQMMLDQPKYEPPALS